MSDRDWRDEEVLPEQTSDDVDEQESEIVDEDLERLLREVPPHHGS